MAEETCSYVSEGRFHEAIAALEAARDTGATPTLEEWIERYPDLAEHLREYFADAQQFKDLIRPPDLGQNPVPTPPDIEIISPVACAVEPPAGRPKVILVTGSTPHDTAELQTLLRQRLRVIAIVAAIGFGLSALQQLLGHRISPEAASLPEFLGRRPGIVCALLLVVAYGA